MSPARAHFVFPFLTYRESNHRTGVAYMRNRMESYTWTRQRGAEALDNPPVNGDHKLGDIYINTHPGGVQDWVWCRLDQGGQGWVRASARFRHPSEPNYVLGRRDETLPTWVTRQTGRTYESERKKIKKDAPLEEVRPEEVASGSRPSGHRSRRRK